MSKQKQKEPLSVMIAKTVLAIAIITGLGTIIFGGGVLIMKYYGNEASNRIIKTVDQEKENYYDALEKKCGGDSCCLASLGTMRKNNFKLAPKSGCLEGFQINSLWCIGAYQWCEPIEENCKKHGEIPDYTSPGDDMSVQCCNGLKHRIQKKYFDENCVNLYEKYGYGGYAGICINCGDNICDTEFENKCNCPEDCGENILGSCCALECEKYRYGTCPEGCTKACVGSCPLCRDCEGEGSCYCPENCEEEIDERFYCEKDDDCLATCTSPGCYNKNWYETVMGGGDCEAVIIHSCECVNNKCQRIEEQPNTSDWQTYRNEEFGFEFKYPKIGEYYGDEIKLFEKGNVIKLCTKDDMGREYNFCHSLEVFRTSEEEIVENAIKKIRIKDEDQSVCFIKEYQLYDDLNFKTYKIVDQAGAASPIGPCGYYGFELFAADPKNSQIFFLLPVIQDSFLDVEKWLKSFKFIES